MYFKNSKTLRFCYIYLKYCNVLILGRLFFKQFLEVVNNELLNNKTKNQNWDSHL